MPQYLSLYPFLIGVRLWIPLNRQSSLLVSLRPGLHYSSSSAV
jgi:hypothetical protein